MNISDAIKNSKGEIFYGMHFYPGVAQYEDPDGAYRVFINEDTIRSMSPSFAGRPVYVDHVEEVDDDLSVVRNEADGWVIESFFNQADGKTWAKFIIVSDRGLAAVRRGYRLSNAYIPSLSDTKATWNGVDYQKIITGGEFEHLAIVQNPRYEESIIMSPDDFKVYNENLKTELIRLANSKDKKKENRSMGKFNIFKRQKVENSVDIEGMMVELPKSKKEISITKLINDYDAILNMNGYANGDHMVKVNDKDEMSVNDLVKAYQAKCNELVGGDVDGGEPGKEKDDINPGDVKENETLDHDDMGERDDDGDKSLDNKDGMGDRDDNGDESLDNEDEADDMSMDNEEDEEKPKKDKKMNAAQKRAAELVVAKAKAARLKNANVKNARDTIETARIDLTEDKIARGKSRYGSGF